MTPKVVINALSAVFALIAAGLWFRSTTATAIVDPNNQGMIISKDTPKGRVDILETAALQTKWNKWAAGSAAMAAALQAIGTAIPG